MVPRNAPPALASLRSITQRLASTPSERLPHVVSYLASTISDCRDLFAASNIQGSIPDGSETSLLIHKFKTQVSSHLQSKSVEARWAAIVLIKAVVEAGDWEILRGVGSWVRGLLGLLGRPEPNITKKLCVITLTRIFFLTREHPSLVREITTPSLPAFITSCLSLVAVRASVCGFVTPKGRCALLSTVLEAFCELLPRHPNVIRPFVAQIKSLVLPLLAATPSSLAITNSIPGSTHTVSSSLAIAAQRLFVLLHYCAPKPASGEDWEHTMRQVIETTHETADQVLRALVEDWEPTSLRPARKGASSKAFGEVVGNVKIGPLDMPSWQGIYGGLERIVGLLDLIQTYLATETASAVAIPVGMLLDLSNRLLLVCPPVRAISGDIGTRINPEIGRDEREGLWDGMPRVHLGVIELLIILAIRCGNAFAASSHAVLEQAIHMLVNQRPGRKIRSSCYALIRHLLQKFGHSLTPSVAPLFSRALKICCDDLLPPDAEQAKRDEVDPAGSKITYGNNSGTRNADAYLKNSHSLQNLGHVTPKTQDEAAALLCTVLTRLPSGFLSFSMQSQIERTAILIQHERMMFASAMHPFTKKDGEAALRSNLPIFARGFPDSLEAEALLRPRMPVLRSKSLINGDRDSELDEDIGFTTSAVTATNYGHSSDNSRLAQNTETFIRNVDDTFNADDIASRQRHSNVVPQMTQGTSEPLRGQDYGISAETNKRAWGSVSGNSNIEASSTVYIANEAPVGKRMRIDLEHAPAMSVATESTRLPSYEDARLLPTETPVTEVPASVPQMSSGTAKMTGTVSEDEESDFEIPPLVFASESDDEGDEVEDERGV